MNEYSKQLLHDALAQVDKKELIKVLWELFEPAIQKLVADTSSKWDDKAYSALKFFVEMFLIPKA